jgi:glucosamine 6-phosphate synthetase-like amidotransferase/phosphosugar isomerase protein
VFLQKIKEITYMHSEGILAGELKHGPLALVDKQMPVIMVIMKDPCFAKCQNALQQVTARQVRALFRAGAPSPLLSFTHAHLTNHLPAVTMDWAGSE